MKGIRELRQYYDAVIRRAWIVLLLIMLVAGGMYWRMRTAGPKYAATTTLIVTAPIIGTAQVSIGGAVSQGQFPPPTVSMVINDIINLLPARPVAEPVAAQLGIPSADVRRALSASRIRDTDLVKLRAVADDPKGAALLANAGADQLIRHFRELSRQDMHEVRLFIEDQLVETRKRLQASDHEILDYKRQHGIVDITQEISLVTTTSSNLRADRDNGILHLRETDAKLAAAHRRLALERPLRVVSGTVKDNPLFQQYEGRLGDLEIQRATLMQMYTPQHPKVQQLEGEIATIRRHMVATARKVIDNEVSEPNPVHDQLFAQIATLEVDRAAGEARLGAIDTLSRRQQLERLRLPAVAVDLAQLVRENGVLAQTYQSLADKYQDALLKENEAGYLRAAVSVMEAAVPPSRQEGDLPVRLSIAVAIGLILGVMVAVMLEVSEDRFRSVQDAEGALGAPVLAAVPDVAPKRTTGSTALLLSLILVITLGLMAPLLAPVITLPARLATSQAFAAIERMDQRVAGLFSWLR